jgi:hypothetical protein
MDRVRRLEDVLAAGAWRLVEPAKGNPWPPHAASGRSSPLHAPGERPA